MRWLSIPTNTAWVLACSGLVAFVAGWQLGWVELFVLAAACLIALVVAVPFVIWRSNVTLERSISPDRVTVGERALAELRATNAGARTSAALVVSERIDGAETPIEIPSLRAGQSTEFLYRLPTDERGVFEIGPATISRGDPLGLLRRPVSETSVERLWVHPRWVAVQPLSAGFAKDLEGPTFDTSPAGDVAFHTIREYQPGDDVRHVHWMSTARKGQLMVRHYVDNRRPQISVVVDHELASRDRGRFELAIEIAASISMSALHRDMPIACRVGVDTVASFGAATTPDRLLDGLAEASTVGAPLTDAIAHVMRLDEASSVGVVVTGGVPSLDLVRATEPLRQRGHLIVVNVHGGDNLIALPRSRALNVASLQEFAAAWDQLG